MGNAPIVDAARDLAELIEAHADDGERARRLPLPTVKALAGAGLMRMCVPEVYGGPEVDPVTMVEAIAEVAHADGAAGWCSMIASTTSSMASFLPPETAQEIYGDRSAITGGVFAPNGKGVSTVAGDVGGFSVTGRWAWGSGTQHCRWVLGGASCDDGTFRLCWFPQADVTFHDTWYTTGMRGSGSLDYSVADVFVPAERTMQPGVTRPVVTTPLSVFPNFTLLAAGVSAVGLGVASPRSTSSSSSLRARSRSTRRERWRRAASPRPRSLGRRGSCVQLGPFSSTSWVRRGQQRSPGTR